MKRNLKSHRQYVSEQIARDPEFAAEYARAQVGVQFGVRLAMLREQHRLTQQALAELAGIKQPMLARYETGQVPTVATLQRLASALKVRVIVAEAAITLEPLIEPDAVPRRVGRPRRRSVARLVSA